jgi:sugar/nucleoside kinase (ribokinase family)
LTNPPRLVCLGNLTIDDVVLPSGVERPACTGGDALYACLAARLFEPACEMVAPVGSDWPAAVSLQIRKAGLSALGLPPKDLPSLHNRIDYLASGDRKWTLFNGEEAFHALSPAPGDIPESYRSADAFLVLAMTLQAQVELVSHLKQASKARVALDPQEDYIEGNEHELRRLIAQCDIFLPSAEEVRRLLRHEDWRAAARTLAELGPQIVVVKLGEEGCLIYDRPSGREITVPAFPSDVVDTTGAGDSFCGAFMAALLQDGSDLEAAARAGAVAASFTVAGYGADPLFAATPAQATQQLADWRC